MLKRCNIYPKQQKVLPIILVLFTTGCRRAESENTVVLRSWIRDCTAHTPPSFISARVLFRAEMWAGNHEYCPDCRRVMNSESSISGDFNTKFRVYVCKNWQRSKKKGFRFYNLLGLVSKPAYKSLFDAQPPHCKMIHPHMLAAVLAELKKVLCHKHPHYIVILLEVSSSLPFALIMQNSLMNRTTAILWGVMFSFIKFFWALLELRNSLDAILGKQNVKQLQTILLKTQK